MKRIALFVLVALMAGLLAMMVVGCAEKPTSLPVVVEKYIGKNLNYEISKGRGTNWYSVTVRIGQPITDGLTFSEEVVGIYEARKVVDEAWARYFIQCQRPTPRRK